MKFQSVLSIAPLRISFLGGGTDIRSFYEKFGGSVVSCAIDKYVYVHIKKHDPLFQERYRISYSDVEHTNDRDKINNKIVKACLEYLNMDEPLQISTSGDLPSSSGLGSSSSFCVALLAGLHNLRGEKVSQYKIAEEACEIEIDILKSPIGKQDQFASAIGGLNKFSFNPDGKVGINPISMTFENISNLFNSFFLIWTTLTRDANVILQSQANQSSKNESSLLILKNMCDEFIEALENQIVDIDRIGELILKGWEIKKSFSSNISNSTIESIENILKENRFSGYKLLGAGGGGFFLGVSKDVNSISSRISKLPNFRPNLDTLGVRIISQI
jgi:D-glycero-alpha-D-manno-heptose-7-phosphate kinase